MEEMLDSHLFCVFSCFLKVSNDFLYPKVAFGKSSNLLQSL